MPTGQTTVQAGEPMPRDAVALVQWLDEKIPRPRPSPKQLGNEQSRLEIAEQLYGTALQHLTSPLPAQLGLARVAGARKNKEQALQYYEAATLGASDAMAFDGGGSVGMFVNGKMVTTQGSGSAKERVLSNAVGIFSAGGGR